MRCVPVARAIHERVVDTCTASEITERNIKDTDWFSNGLLALSSRCSGCNLLPHCELWCNIVVSPSPWHLKCSHAAPERHWTYKVIVLWAPAQIDTATERHRIKFARNFILFGIAISRRNGADCVARWILHVEMHKLILFNLAREVRFCLWPRLTCCDRMNDANKMHSRQLTAASGCAKCKNLSDRDDASQRASASEALEQQLKCRN